jgi:hypothetical protein
MLTTSTYRRRGLIANHKCLADCLREQQKDIACPQTVQAPQNCQALANLLRQENKCKPKKEEPW